MPVSKKKLSFICDNMLKGLSRWLRFLGFQSWNATDISKLQHLAQQQVDAVILSASKNHLEIFDCNRTYLISDHQIELQLQALDYRYKLFNQIELFTLCSICNVILSKITMNQVPEEIPSRIKSLHQQFWKCPACHRIYWKGTHVKRMLDKMRRMGVAFKNTEQKNNIKI